MPLPSKEKEAFISEREKFPIVEVIGKPKIPENSPELSKKIESLSDDEMVLSQPIIGEDGAVILDNPTSPQITITLPLTDDQINQALHLKILHSLRWLAEWAKRLLKITGGKFVYKF
ncbi:MAG: hypothetical protein NT052_01525 [Candidatus Shapirobacteria bacterium]|nr:hypothetical protein [Candidatus Shapirobacteria bacterium]